MTQTQRKKHARGAPNGAATLPLFDWADRNRPTRTERDLGDAATSARLSAAARIVLRADLRDAEGEPRACIAIPGRPPLAFPSISAALAALNRMEAAHAGR